MATEIGSARYERVSGALRIGRTHIDTTETHIDTTEGTYELDMRHSAEPWPSNGVRLDGGRRTAQLMRDSLDSGPAMVQDEELTKIVVDLPNHWATGGKSMWAKPLGDALYELRNVPFYAYGLNFGDVVRAVQPALDKKPVISELIRAGGHRTLRVHFSDSVTESDRPALLRTLNELHAYFEGANERYFAIDVEPHGDYNAVCEKLAAWEAQGFLEYETCEGASGWQIR